MRIYKITDPQGKYTSSLFLETMDGIYAENEEIGFFKHPTIKTHKQLLTHLRNMKKDGLTVVIYGRTYE